MKPLAEYILYMIVTALNMVIDIDNVADIKEKTRLVGAERIEQSCIQFCKDNKETLLNYIRCEPLTYLVKVDYSRLRSQYTPK